MKRMHLILVALVLTTLGASLVQADTSTPRVDRREVRQHQRIRQGVRSGQLTRGEAARLRAGQRHVDRMERRAKADGHVSRHERRRLAHAQNVQSRRIYRLKHNRRQRTL